MYIDKTVKDYIEATGEKTSAPGGGSVLALVSSLGLALSEMAMNFSVDKSSFLNLDENLREDILSLVTRVKELRDKVNELIDLDTQAFNQVLEAYKLPKDDRTRARKIENGYKIALEVPLKCFRYSLESLELEYRLAEYSHKSLITDTAIGAILSYSAMEGSVYNIKINLSGIKDEKFIEATLEELDKSLIMARKYKELILEISNSKL